MTTLPENHVASELMRSVKVWDLGIRLFHWGLVFAVAIAALTGFFGSPGTVSVHIVAGITIALLLLFRIIWGFTGSTYARFRSFSYHPVELIKRIRQIKMGKHVRYLGHNPLGAAMVFSLIVVLILIILTGVVVLGGVLKQGPLAFIMTYATGSVVKEAHQILAFALVAMIGLHLAGVIYETLIGQEKLIQAMISGHKAAGAHVDHPKVVQPRIFTGLVLVLAAGLLGLGIVAFLSSKPALGVPSAALDSTYVQECGACHYAYHPSMGSAALWTGILDGLSEHFGEDASLPDATRNQIQIYLLANSAERWDTRIAKVLAKSNPENPLRFTATRFWTRMHSDLPEVLFKSKPIGFKGNCAACHQDAKLGLFAPQSINVPQGEE